MRRLLTKEEILDFQSSHGLAINGDIPIYLTEDETDLIEGLEVNQNIEVMRYIVVSPESYEPPFRDDKKLLEELYIEEEDKVLGKVTIVYEVIKDKIKDTKSYNIILSRLEKKTLDALADAKELIKIDRELKTFVDTSKEVKSTLMFDISTILRDIGDLDNCEEVPESQYKSTEDEQEYEIEQETFLKITQDTKSEEQNGEGE